MFINLCSRNYISWMRKKSDYSMQRSVFSFHCVKRNRRVFIACLGFRGMHESFIGSFSCKVTWFVFLVSHFVELRYPWPMRFERKNCLPFGYSNNQFERPLTFKSSHTCRFCFYAVVELRAGRLYCTTPFIGYNSPIFRRLKNRPVLIFYGATCKVNWFTLLTAWSNNGVDNFARLLMLTPRSDWINSSSFGFVRLAPQRSLLFVQKASRGAGFFNAKQNFLSTQPLDAWSKV